jgi:hypothetical protein
MTSHEIFSNGMFWYVEVETSESFNFEYLQEAIPNPILQLIHKKTVSLIISLKHESHVSILEPLYSILLEKFHIDEKSVILLTGARDIENYLIPICKKYNKDKIKVILMSEFEWHIQKPEQLTKTNNIHRDIRDKKFINLNRNWRIHRPVFVSLLIAHDLLKHGFVSLIEDLRPDHNWSLWSRMLDQYPDYRDLLSLHKEKIINSTPLTVDNTDLSINPLWVNPEVSDFYNNSYFSIVSETNFNNTESRFLTEKTYKTIVHKHPFIILSVPNSLSYFKEKGYRTFHPYINESYDQEIDDQKRMGMVLSETKRLCELSNEKLAEFVAETRKICDFNYEVFINKTAFNVLLVDK